MTTTGYTLKGITAGRGTCEHCGRSLARLFRIGTPNGEDMTVGRTCSANLTGYTWTVAQAESIEKMRLAEIAAANKYGDMWTEAVTRAWDATISLSARYAAGQAVVTLRDGKWMTEAEKLAFARELLAVA